MTHELFIKLNLYFQENLLKRIHEQEHGPIRIVLLAQPCR